MKSKKIVLIGAGSLAFTPNLLAETILSEDFQGATIALVDIDPTKLEVMARLANRMVEEKRTDIEIQSTIDRREALKGADFVIMAISVGGSEALKLDGDVPLKYGIYQTVADTVGPGGFSRALRHIPPMVDICCDVEKVAPEAIVFNETNPMSVICRAVRRVTGVDIVGLCNGIIGTKAFLARFLGYKPEETQVIAAGINHLTWITDFRIRGENAYPLLKGKWVKFRPRIESTHEYIGGKWRYSISFKLFEIFGVFPSPGDSHIAEFYPYFLTEERGGGERYGLQLYPGETIYDPRWREKAWEKVLGWAEKRRPLDELFQRGAMGERSLALDMIATIMRGSNKLFEAANIPNKGFVTNLRREAIVEVPVIVGPSGIRGVHVGKLPEGIAATLQNRITQQELTVDAALTGDRRTALQALLLDPMVNTIETAERLLEDLINANANYLPQFKLS